jgi:hypothetical protein
VVRVSAFRSKVHGSKHSRGRQTFKDDKNPQHVSFGGEVKPSEPCRWINLKNPSEHTRDT